MATTQHNIGRQLPAAQLPAFLWKIADILRGSFQAADYGKVILPLTVLRRVDCVINSAAYQQKVAETSALRKYLLDKTHELLDERRVKFEELVASKTQCAVYTTASTTTLTEVCRASNSAQMQTLLDDYIQGLSPSAQDVLRYLDLQLSLDKLLQAGKLLAVLEQFIGVDLSPEYISNADMGLLFEELIRTYADSVNESAGQFFTPRDVVHLLTHCLVDPATLDVKAAYDLYDPTCGTGGILSDFEACLHAMGVPKHHVTSYGQELDPKAIAICKADLLLKGQKPTNIHHGNTLTNDLLRARTFKFIGANPPFGVDWKDYKASVEADITGRFAAGMPRTSDGSMLFIQHIVHKMDPEGARAGVVLHGSPLFSGDAGSGESEIRRFLIERDLLDAVIALPTELFYNTGIPTFLWILDNKKPDARKGRVQLIDATRMGTRMKKSQGSKRVFLSSSDIDAVVKALADNLVQTADTIADTSAPYLLSNSFDNHTFGARKLTIQVPLAPSEDEASSKKKTKTVKYDSALKDSESLPLATIQALMDSQNLSHEEATREAITQLMASEVLPWQPNAVIDPKTLDAKDRLPGIVGYSINFAESLPHPAPAATSHSAVRDAMASDLSTLVRLFQSL